jgi:hypothetical protein
VRPFRRSFISGDAKIGKKLVLHGQEKTLNAGKKPKKPSFTEYIPIIISCICNWVKKS